MVLAGCNSYPTFGSSHGASTQGQDIGKLYSGMFFAGIGVAVIVWGLILWCMVAYRRKRSDDTIPRQFQDKPVLEIIWTLIPLVMVIVIFVFTIGTENRVDAITPHPNVSVTVSGYQWGWTFSYKDANGLTIQTARGGTPNALPAAYDAKVYPQLVLPEGETTRITLVSQDVIHDFYVHAFNFDRFAQPGVHNQFDITPTRLGVYPAQCSEYCGLYHSEMLFSVAVLTPAKYKAWLAQAERHPNQPPAHFPIPPADQHI
jgi:cytochrome c oxidase subunit 2